MKKYCLLAGLFMVLSVQAFALGDLPDFSGRIAIIGSDHNVYTITPAQTIALTTDGSASVAYQWPTWARDGRLAYFCCDLATSQTFETGVFISSDGLSTGRQVISGFGQPVIYANWSPSVCRPDNNCRDLAILVNDLSDNQLRVQLIRDLGDDRTVSEVGIGSPFYSTFSADGAALLLHRNNADLDIYDIESDSTESVIAGDSSGTFQTAAWSPVDNRLLFGVRGTGNTTDLVIADGDNQQVLVTGIVGQVAFTWSPDGTKIAYRAATRELLEGVNVVDAQSGAVISTSGQDVFAFWWSPDSQRIALLTIARNTGNTAQSFMQTVSQRRVQANTPPLVKWAVADVATGDVTPFAPFVANYEMAYMGGYFDQFAVSHAVWSPDSRYLVYSETFTREDRDQVTLLDTQTGETFKLADGSMGVWSWE